MINPNLFRRAAQCLALLASLPTSAALAWDQQACRTAWHTKLQIIHSSDNESSFQDPNTLEEKVVYYGAISSGLRRMAKRECIPSLHLTAGDHTIPGPFYQASAEISDYGQPGLADIAMYNAMGLDANGLGNHEFDGGINEFAHMLHAANYPMIAVNLDFSQIALEEGTPAIEAGPDAQSCVAARGKIVKSCWLRAGGERVGLIGRAPADFFNVILDPATTLPGLDFVGGRDAATNQPLASAVDQVLEQVAKLEGQGIDRIVLLDHAQDFTADPLSASRLAGIDIIVAAGSTGFMGRAKASGPFNYLREEDTPNADYPTVRSDMDGQTVLVVNSEQLYRYVGHLIVQFDTAGHISRIDKRSGPIATVPKAVHRLADYLGRGRPRGWWGSKVTAPAAVEENLASLQNTPLIQDAFTQVGTTVQPLNGQRADVRTRETNLSRIVAESTLWGAQQYADNNPQLNIPAIDVALKNGGGIRDSISGPAIIRLTIQAALAFDNDLSIVSLTGDTLLATMENAVSRNPSADGRFPQLAGIYLEYDNTRPDLEAQTSVTTPSRVRTLIVTRADGSTDELVLNYAAQGDLGARTFTMATNSFLTTGGDGYASLAAAPVLGTTHIGEQQILEEYILGPLGGAVDAQDPPAVPNVVAAP